MGFVIGTILAFVFLEGIWRALVIVGAFAWEVFEIAIWLRWRKRRSITGAEAMVGATGTALTDCKPDGQVSVRGQIWKAHASPGVVAGDDIVVDAVEGLRLDVRAR